MLKKVAIALKTTNQSKKYFVPQKHLPFSGCLLSVNYLTNYETI